MRKKKIIKEELEEVFAFFNKKFDKCIKIREATDQDRNIVLITKKGMNFSVAQSKAT